MKTCELVKLLFEYDGKTDVVIDGYWRSRGRGTV